MHRSSTPPAATMRPTSAIRPSRTIPASTGIFIADILSGAYAFGAIQAALVHRERTGQGQAVDVSLMDSMLNLMVFECQEAQFPSEQKRPVYVPMKTRDGHVIIAPISQKNFEQMADAMKRPDLKTDARFSTGQARVQHWTELMAIIEQWTEQRTGIEIEIDHGRQQRSLLPISHRRGRHEGSATGGTRQPVRDQRRGRRIFWCPTRHFSFSPRRRRPARRYPGWGRIAWTCFPACSGFPVSRSTSCDAMAFFF